MRYFRTSSVDLYESVRLQLDAAWGLPNATTGTVTSIAPADVAPHDSSGRVLLAVHAEFATWEPAATILPQLLATGAVEEITRADYMAGLTPPYPQATVNINVVPAGPNRVRVL